MLGEHHHLVNEFPEFKDKIHELKTSDAHFARLFDEYIKLDDEVYRAEEQIEVHGDDFVEELKKKRVALKDELYNMLKNA